MKKLLMLGLSALCAGLTVQAAVAATRPVIAGPAYSIDGVRQPLKQPANFDASLAGSGTASQHALRNSRAPLLKAPAVLSNGLRFERLQPAPIVSDHYDAKLERPTFIWAGKQAGDSLAFLAYRQGEGARSYAQAYLHEFASQLKIGPAMVDDARLVFLHDDGEGAVIARYQQRVNGLDVMNRQLNVVMNQDLELIAISGYFASAKSAAGEDFSDAFRAGPTAAMNAAFADLDLPVSAYNLYDTNKTRGGFAQFAPTAGVASAAVRLTAPVGAKKVLFPVGNDLVPGYLLTVQAGQTGIQDSLGYAYVASADGSRVLFRKNLVANDSYQYRVFADATTLQPDDSPFGNALVPHPTGNPGDPLTKNPGAGTLVTVADGSQGITDAWLPATIAAPPGFGTPLFVPAFQTTFGNNVYAYADVGGADGPDDGVDIFAATTAAGVFDYTADFTKQPDDTTTNNQQAAIVNLFYLNNWLHDAWYKAGFTEINGNAQYDNYGRGGLEDTYILAEAQDSSGRNNANMSTGPDGTYTRMQMYIFDGPVETQRVEITAPVAVAQVLDPTGSAEFGPQEYTTLSGSVVLYTDADNNDACEVATNAGALAGNIALIDRGVCSFTVKAANAEAAGAIAALIVNNDATNPDDIINMGGTDPASTIPSLMISNNDGQIIKDELTTGGGSVTVEMERAIANDREGAFDSQVVAHEFFHYVSNRLVGDASGLSNQQGGGMGEGWGDVAGLLLTARADDLATAPDGAYGMGGYDTDNFYQAIRRYPYTTQMAKNPLTFADIATDLIEGEAEVHNLGEIWAIALWEAYVGLYNHYETVDAGTAFTVAKTKMMGYIIDGLMATPNAPTMIEARDAILSVVQAADATDYGIFVTAFAKRGMGFGAIAPPRNSIDMAGVEESFATDLKAFVVQGAALDPDAPTVCDVDSSLDPGETGEVSITLLNTGSAELTGITAQLSSTDDLTFADSGLVTFTPDPLAMFGGTATATTTVTVNSATTTSELLDIDVVFPDVGATAGEVTEPAAIQVQFLSNQDYQRTAFADDVENTALSLVDWTRGLVGGGAGWAVDSAFSAPLGLPAGNDYWYGPDNDQQSDITLTTPPIVVGGNPFSVSFYHYYQFEDGGWDGGVVEITTDGGATWQDVTAAGGTFAFGYNGAIVSSNPVLGDRVGFIDFGGTAYDGALESISFGTALAGQTVQLRFRVGSDPFVGNVGWIVDDITVTGAAVPVFSSVVAENGVCGDAAPVADAGVNQNVVPGDTVTLDGSGSTDDGTLSYAWTQAGGTAVTLSDDTAASPTFTAPFGTASYTFLLTVTDDQGQTATDTVAVTVTDAAPTANAGADQNVVPGDTVTLDGTGSSDVEGTISYAWTQTAGDSVTLSDATAASPTFTAPFGSASYTFQLTITDEGAQTASDTVTVTVQDEAPVANAGADQNVVPGDTVTLDGTGSSDVEGTISYAWTQTAGDSVTLSDATAASPTFTAPVGDGVYTFELTVTDEGAQTASDTVTVTVQDEAPVANAGADQSVEGGATVTLDGSASSDAEGDVTYAWTQTAGDSVTLSDDTAAKPSFTAADADATLTFELTVTDEAGQTSKDSVSVTVTKSQDDQGDDDDDQGDDNDDQGNNGGGGGGGSTGLLLLSGLLGLGLLRRRRH